MTRTPRIPMLPSELPQQRLYLVKGLPERPANWTPRTGQLASEVAPVAMPRTAGYIGQVEWAWSSVNTRIDAYYLSMCSRRRNWVLWLKGYDDNWSRWTAPRPQVVAPRCGLRANAAARLLLFEYWTKQRTENVDRFHWINESDQVDAGALAEIGSAVWGDDGVHSRETHAHDGRTWPGG